MSSEVQRYITGIMTPVEMANPGPASISARQTVVVTYEDYAALEAENARLIAMIEDWEADANLLEKERDAARAQLAAIQGGMGEEVEVVAWRHFGDASRLLCDLGKQRSVPGDYAAEFNIPLMTVAQHQRITAAMAAEVERLKLRLYDFEHGDLDYALKERDALRAELAEVKGREPVLWFRSLIGAQCKPDGRCYDVVFSPCEGFMPLYTTPPASPDVEGLVKALIDIRRTCHCRHTAEGLQQLIDALSTWRQAQASQQKGKA